MPSYPQVLSYLPRCHGPRGQIVLWSLLTSWFAVDYVTSRSHVPTTLTWAWQVVTGFPPPSWSTSQRQTRTSHARLPRCRRRRQAKRRYHSNACGSNVRSWRPSSSSSCTFAWKSCSTIPARTRPFVSVRCWR